MLHLNLLTQAQMKRVKISTNDPDQSLMLILEIHKWFIKRKLNQLPLGESSNCLELEQCILGSYSYYAHRDVQATAKVGGVSAAHGSTCDGAARTVAAPKNSRLARPALAQPPVPSLHSDPGYLRFGSLAVAHCAWAFSCYPITWNNERKNVRF